MELWEGIHITSFSFKDRNDGYPNLWKGHSHSPNIQYQPHLL